MRTRAVWMAAVAGLLLVGCTEEGEPDLADPDVEATTEVSLPADTETDTGEPTTDADTASPTDTETDAGAAGDDATDDATAGAAGGDAALSECAQAVDAAGGLADVRNAEAQLGPVFEACPSFEEFQAAAEAQLEGFQDVDLRPYAQNMCTFVPDLASTPLCQSI